MKQFLLFTVTIAVLSLPGVAMFLAYPRAPASAPVIYIIPQSFGGNVDMPMPRCALKDA